MARWRVPLYNVHMPAEAAAAASEVLKTGAIARGQHVDAFERQLGEYLQNRYVLSTSDVSASLTLSLFMAGVRPNDEVLTSPMTCLATTMPIANLFARPRWCDVDPSTGNLDPADLERRVSKRSRAILLYHWTGNPTSIDDIYAVGARHGLPVIEDAGEALGAEYKGRRIGATGARFTAFSFYPNRQLTTGEGGAISLAAAADFERAQWLRRYGIHQPSFRDRRGEIDPTSEIGQAGFNYAMNNVAGAVGSVQMTYLAGIVKKHQDNGAFYDQTLTGTPGIQLMRREQKTRPAYWVYSLLADRRDDLLAHLHAQGVQASAVHYRNDIYSCFGPQAELPGVAEFMRRTISIPCGWWVGPEQRDYVVGSVRSFA